MIIARVTLDSAVARFIELELNYAALSLDTHESQRRE